MSKRFAILRDTEVVAEGDQIFHDPRNRYVEVMAVAGIYAMVRIPACSPFVADSRKLDYLAASKLLGNSHE